MAVGLVAVLTPEEADLQFRTRRSCAVVVMMAGYGCDGRAKPQWLLAADVFWVHPRSQHFLVCRT
jgi:hypothetical protein